MNPVHEPDLQFPLHAKALQALRQAVAQVIAKHKRDGRPLAVLRDGQVVWISAEEAEAELLAAQGNS